MQFYSAVTCVHQPVILAMHTREGYSHTWINQSYSPCTPGEGTPILGPTCHIRRAHPRRVLPYLGQPVILAMHTRRGYSHTWINQSYSPCTPGEGTPILGSTSHISCKHLGKVLPYLDQPVIFAMHIHRRYSHTWVNQSYLLCTPGMVLPYLGQPVIFAVHTGDGTPILESTSHIHRAHLGGYSNTWAM